MKRVFYSLIALLLTGMVYAQQAKYVFYFIGDGMGVNQVNGTEMYLAEQEGRIGVTPLLFTTFPVASVATTFSATNSVTDSSAAGTALATGAKTYNGAIGVDDQKNVLQSVAEKAKKAGKRVGVTTSVSVDHATPAAFYAHQPNRSMYYEIALDLPKAGFDFYAGGGFIPPSTGRRLPASSPSWRRPAMPLPADWTNIRTRRLPPRRWCLSRRKGLVPTVSPMPSTARRAT